MILSVYKLEYTFLTLARIYYNQKKLWKIKIREEAA